MTEGASLTTLADIQLESARGQSSGRSSVTVYGGRDLALRQTLIAMVGGQALGEHENPGEATLQVLRGRVRLTAGDEQWEGGVGDHLVIPHARHDLTALEDAAVLLTVAMEKVPPSPSSL
ncbi:MAG: cupin domain-containing protein [Aeromicrobium sp.]|uniref:cupin domain-containing protein n=1 Tax=Aeromicrobium sp. TaxID=1871063 RepID=UPI0039E2ABB5